MKSRLSLLSFYFLLILANSCGDKRPQWVPRLEPKLVERQSCPNANDMGGAAVDRMLAAYATTTQYSDLGKVVGGKDKAKMMEVRFRTSFQGSSPSKYVLSFDSGMARFGTRENKSPWSQFLVLEPEDSSFRNSKGVEVEYSGHAEAIAKLGLLEVMAVGIVPSFLSQGELPYVKNRADWKGAGTGVVNGFELCKLVGNNANRKIEVWVGREDGLIRRVKLNNLSKGSTVKIDYLKIRRNRTEYIGSGPLDSGPTGSFLPKINIDGTRQSCPVLSGDWCFWKVQDACAATCPGDPCSLLAVSNPPQVVCGQ